MVEGIVFQLKVIPAKLVVLVVAEVEITLGQMLMVVLELQIKDMQVVVEQLVHIVVAVAVVLAQLEVLHTQQMVAELVV